MGKVMEVMEMMGHVCGFAGGVLLVAGALGLMSGGGGDVPFLVGLGMVGIWGVVRFRDGLRKWVGKHTEKCFLVLGFVGIVSLVSLIAGIAGIAGIPLVLRILEVDYVLFILLFTSVGRINYIGRDEGPLVPWGDAWSWPGGGAGAGAVVAGLVDDQVLSCEGGWDLVDVDWVLLGGDVVGEAWQGGCGFHRILGDVG